MNKLINPEKDVLFIKKDVQKETKLTALEMAAHLFSNTHSHLLSSKLPGKKVLIRLLPKKVKTDSGLIVPKFETIIKDSGRTASVESDFQYETLGVVINLGVDCSESFRHICKIGSLVFLDPSTMNINSPRKYSGMITDPFDNYYMFHEASIEQVLQTNPPNYEHYI